MTIMGGVTAIGLFLAGVKEWPLLGALLGLLGILVATPLMVSAGAVLRYVYVERTLEKR